MLGKWRHGLVPSLPSRNKRLEMVIKYYSKADIKVFCFYQVFLGFFGVFSILEFQTLSPKKEVFSERKFFWSKL